MSAVPRLAVDELLAAPRGQRLCLAFAEIACSALGEAQGAEAWRSEALYRARYRLDTGAGSAFVASRSAAAFGAVATDSQPAEALANVVDRAMAAVADVPLPAATVDLLLEALTMTVDEAYYWQPPGGLQVLGSLPELRAPLARIAAHILAAPASRWWANDAASSPQWQSYFGGGGESAWDEGGLETQAGPRDTAEVLEQWGREIENAEERGRRQRTIDPTAEWSGEWRSTPPHGLLESTRAIEGYGPLRLHLQEDSNGPELAVVTRVGLAHEHGPGHRLRAGVAPGENRERHCRVEPRRHLLAE